MKKKYLYSLVTLFTVICGFTAWSAGAGVKALAESDSGALTLNASECIPAADSSVESVSDIVLTFGANDTNIKLNPDFNDPLLAFISYVQVNGTGGTATKTEQEIMLADAPQ